jgi:hypothetical protein
MPFYRFIIHGKGVLTNEGCTGFYTTRWAFGRSEALAAEAALKSVRKAWESGEYEGWSKSLPTLEIEDGWEIGVQDLWKAPNKGSTFYVETDSGRA